MSLNKFSAGTIYSAHKSPQLNPILNQMYPFQILTPLFLKIYFNIILPYATRSLTVSSLQVLKEEIMNVLIISLAMLHDIPISPSLIQFCTSYKSASTSCSVLSARWLPSLASPAAQPPDFINELPADRPNPQHLYYVPEVPHSFPKRPIPDTFPHSQFLGQLGQYIQQGVANHYIGNFPAGQQIFNQFAGVQGQYPEGQFYTPSAPPVTPVRGALASIATHDDLRCVPRLLCEVAAGGRPGYSGSKQQDSSVPFVNRDTLLS